MFVYDLGEIEDARMGENPYDKTPYADLKRTPRPLRNEDYMGDTIVQKARQRRKFKFVLKRKIFLPKYNYRGDDPFFERMTYLQAEDETSARRCTWPPSPWPWPSARICPVQWTR
jgi:hypothetical protein